MKRFSDRHGLSTLSELNVTPLLDLAFVLLIIFMITTPLMDTKTDLVVPSSSADSKTVDPSAVQTIALDREARVSFNGQPASLEQVTALLVAKKDAQPDVAVVIRSHKELPVQRLIEVMDVVQKARITRVGVVTSPEQ